MTVLTDRQLMQAGLLTDMVLGFRAGMKGRRPRDPALVAMPEHFSDERNLSRCADFRKGVRIAMIWRNMRTGSGVGRREDRNRQFREQGAAHVIDRDEVRKEAIRFLHYAIAQTDGFPRPDPNLVHEIVTDLDHSPRTWDTREAVCFYHADGKNGILSTTSEFALKAMGQSGWKSPEAVFHAQKFPGNYDIQDAIFEAATPLAAKAIAREHKAVRRRDWSSHRPTAMVRVMVLRAEQDTSYRTFLLSTQGHPIVEDTTDGDHDPFWGVVDGHGVNLAGQIATALRTRLADGDRRIYLR